MEGEVASVSATSSELHEGPITSSTTSGVLPAPPNTVKKAIVPPSSRPQAGLLHLLGQEGSAAESLGCNGEESERTCNERDQSDGCLMSNTWEATCAASLPRLGASASEGGRDGGMEGGRGGKPGSRTLPFVLLKGVLWEQRQVRKEEGGKKTCEALSLASPIPRGPDQVLPATPLSPLLTQLVFKFWRQRYCELAPTELRIFKDKTMLHLQVLPPSLPPCLPLPCSLTSRRSPPPRPSSFLPSQASPSLRLPSSRRPSCPTAKLSHCAQARGGGREGGRKGVRKGGREGGRRAKEPVGGVRGSSLLFARGRGATRWPGTDESRES